MIILLISTLKVVLFSRKLSNFHWLFSFPVTDLLYRNQYSFVPQLLLTTCLPFQYFYKYDCDYPSDDKTRQTLPKLFAKIHCLQFHEMLLKDLKQLRAKMENTSCSRVLSLVVEHVSLPVVVILRITKERAKGSSLLKNIFVSAERGGQKWNKRIKVAFT